MILSFRTDIPGQTVQTQIKLLLVEQSDQGLHCLPFRLYHWTLYPMVEPHSSNFRVITTNVLGVQIFRKYTVIRTIMVLFGSALPLLLTWCIKKIHQICFVDTVVQY